MTDYKYEDVDGPEFIKQLKEAAGWAMVVEPGTNRLLMVVQTPGQPDRHYRSPDPLEMNELGYKFFIASLDQVADEKGFPKEA